MAQKSGGILARTLLTTHGYDSLSYFVLHNKKKFFFSSTGGSFLSYAIRSKVALVTGDPVGPSNEIPVLLKEFSFFLKGAGLTACFVGIHANTVPHLINMRYKKISVGEEAILHLNSFKKGSLKKKVRRAERHILSLGITCKFFRADSLPKEYFEEIKNISKNWVRAKGGKERGFAMTLGRIPNASDADCEYTLGIKDGRVLGFLLFVPIYASRGLSLDMARKRIDAPNGLNEFLLLQSFEHYKNEGKLKISLNFAAFHDLNSPGKTILKQVVLKTLQTFFHTDKIYQFNKKFMPEWHKRYVFFEKKRNLPYYIYAVAKSELSIN